MFGREKQARAAKGGRRAMLSVVSPDMAVIGDVSAGTGLHIDGRVEGDVACATLVQGGDSHIVGNVRADTARIAGTIEGAVKARELAVERGARIVGDVEYESITIETGGHVDGRLNHVGGSDDRPAEIEGGDNIRLLAAAENG